MEESILSQEIFINRLNNKKVVLLPPSKLKDLMNHFEIIKEIETFVSGKIRILKFDQMYYVQELTAKDEAAVRKMNSKEEAENFVNERMIIYEKMWDGCGCKVNYYE